MCKVDVLRVLTAVALLRSVVDAAPLQQHASGDPQTTGGDTEKNTARVKLLNTKTLTTFPDGDGKTAAMRALDEIITATSSPGDKTASDRLKTFTILSDGHEEILSAIGGHDRSQMIDRTTGSPSSHRQTEKSRLFRLLKVIDPDEQDTSGPVTEDPEPREEMLKMLSALEELHTFINSHPLTVMTRGNSNGRNPGKKNKMVVTDGNLKSTTATTVDSGGISPKASTDQTDPKLSGKGLKKSLPSAKKPNKRVCFWKYCSQN